jgi:hypothetical protein
MPTLSEMIKSASTAQDVELASAIGNLSPANVTTYLNTHASSLRDRVSQEHSDNFQKTYSDMVRSGNTIKNVIHYYERNEDLKATQDAILARARAEANNAQYDNQTSKRQFEINEWTANNKLDTLFVLQLLFIGLTLLVPLLYLNRIGILPSSAYYGVSLIVLIAIILTFVVRLQYTSQTRDLRFWNRRRFAKQGGPPVPPTCADIAAAAQETANTISDAAASFGSALE